MGESEAIKRVNGANDQDCGEDFDRHADRTSHASQTTPATLGSTQFRQYEPLPYPPRRAEDQCFLWDRHLDVPAGPPAAAFSRAVWRAVGTDHARRIDRAGREPAAKCTPACSRVGSPFIKLSSPRIGGAHRLAKNFCRLSRWSSIDYMPVRVRSVEVLDGYRLRLSFDDGVVTEVDFADDLWGPMAEPLVDRGYSRRCGWATSRGPWSGPTATIRTPMFCTVTSDPPMAHT